MKELERVEQTQHPQPTKPLSSVTDFQKHGIIDAHLNIMSLQ
jgi:hypothetical protein